MFIARTDNVMADEETPPLLRHRYSMDATLKRSIPVVEAEAQVSMLLLFETVSSTVIQEIYPHVSCSVVWQRALTAHPTCSYACCLFCFLSLLFFRSPAERKYGVQAVSSS